MIRHFLAILILSFVIVLFEPMFTQIMTGFLSWHNMIAQFIVHHTSGIAGNDRFFLAFQQAIILLAIPLGVTIVFGLIFRLVNRRYMSYAIEAGWIIWFIMTTITVMRG